MAFSTGMNKGFLLLYREKVEEAVHRKQQHFWSSLIQVCSCQKIGANHLQAIPSRAVAAQHQSSGFERTVDDRNLALVEFESYDLPGLPVFSRQFPFHFSSELVFGHFPRFVQPGCTIELLPI